MQKFGLQRSSASQLGAIELEVVKEQASALGRAGRKLRISLEYYNKLDQEGLSSEIRKKSLQDIADRVWELMLQREILGFSEGNLGWIRENYHIPDAAFNKLSVRA